MHTPRWTYHTQDLVFFKLYQITRRKKHHKWRKNIFLSISNEQKENKSYKQTEIYMMIKKKRRRVDFIQVFKSYSQKNDDNAFFFLQLCNPIAIYFLLSITLLHLSKPETYMEMSQPFIQRIDRFH